MDKINLTNTKRALFVYDILDIKFLDTGLDSSEQLLALLKQLEEMGEYVGYIYGLETQDRNDPETCRRYIRPGPNEVAIGMDDVSIDI